MVTASVQVFTNGTSIQTYPWGGQSISTVTTYTNPLLESILPVQARLFPLTTQYSLRPSPDDEPNQLVMSYGVVADKSLPERLVEKVILVNVCSVYWYYVYLFYSVFYFYSVALFEFEWRMISTFENFGPKIFSDRGCNKEKWGGESLVRVLKSVLSTWCVVTWSIQMAIIPRLRCFTVKQAREEKISKEKVRKFW